MSMVLYLRRARPVEADAIADGSLDVQRFMFENVPPGNVVDFDRAWHALHYLLTGSIGGTDDSLSLLVGVDGEIGEDQGYGPARWIAPDRVAKFAQAFQGLSDDLIRDRFDPASPEWASVYSGYLFSEDGIEFDYIQQWLPDFRRFIVECVAARAGILALIL